MGRGLELSVVTMLQFPEQLRDGSGGERVYRELLNNVGSVLCGHLDNPSMLSEKLATPKTSADEVAELLGGCPDDRWVFSPATSRSLESRTSPLMLIRDPPLPRGHPDGATDL